jgi:TolA-binding protein
MLQQWGGDGNGRCPHLGSVQRFVDSGDFEGALRASQEVLDRDPGGPAGEAALFDLALLNAHPGNAKKDYRRSLQYFDRLVREYPKSPLVGEAKVWIGVLESIEKSKKIDIDIEEKKKGINK